MQDVTMDQFMQKVQGNPLLQSITAGYIQPGASLAQTQASTQSTAAGIPGVEAQSGLSEFALKQKSALDHITESLKGAADKNGYADPQTYNGQRKLAAALGIDGDTFDKNFSTFVDPTSQISYNTSSGIALQQRKNTLLNSVLPTVNNLMDKYNSLGLKGPIEGQIASNPLSKYLNIGGSESDYERQRQNFASTLLDTANKTDFTGLGINKTQLQDLANALPSINDSQGEATSKIGDINNTLSKIQGKQSNIKYSDKNDAVTGGGLLKGILGAVANPYIDAINEAGNSQNQALKDNPGNPLGAAAQATGGMATAISKTIPNDVAMSLPYGKVLGKVLGIGGNIAEKSPIPTDIVKSLVTLGQSGGKKAAGEAIQEAAGKGTDIAWDDIANAAKERAANMGTRVQNELETLLKDEAPVPKTPGEIANPQVTSPQALELRKGLGERLPGSFWPNELQKALGQGGSVVPRNKAVGILRDAVSSALKEAAPDIKNPDKLYSFYSKVGGDAPTWAKRLLMYEAGKRVGEKLPFLGPLINQLPG